MKLWIWQINTRVGNLAYNEQKIVDTIKQIWKESDLIVFPEMTTTGYPPNDLLDNDDFVIEQKEIIYRIRDLVRQTNDNLKVIMWFVDYDQMNILPSGKMTKYNAAAVIWKDIKIYHKELLPNYDVFFEQRYFVAGKEPLKFQVSKDLTGALSICEDIWDKGYEVKPLQSYIKTPVAYLINISSSPFSLQKQKTRLDLLRNHSRNIWSSIIYVNQVGAQDELVFDWGSMVLDKWGCLRYRGKKFQEDVTVLDLDEAPMDHGVDVAYESNDIYGQALWAMKLWLQNYLEKTGIKKVVIWVSGGIDSALSLYVLSQALPKDAIHAIYMPTKHNSETSQQLAQKLCENIWVQLHIGPIDSLVKSFMEFNTNVLGKTSEWITYENLQARIRGNILMTIANDIKWMVINNSNKTELALWYWTLYWDLIWWLSLVWDLNKREIYEMSNYINDKHHTDIIPRDIITRQASAELADGQVDPFDYMRISDAVEELQFGASISKMAEKYHISPEELQSLKRKIQINEFKGRQTPPVIKLKNRSVWIGRMFPIVQG